DDIDAILWRQHGRVPSAARHDLTVPRDRDPARRRIEAERHEHAPDVRGRNATTLPVHPQLDGQRPRRATHSRGASVPATAWLAKRSTPKGASAAGAVPLTIHSAKWCAVAGASRTPLRKWPVAT